MLGKFHSSLPFAFICKVGQNNVALNSLWLEYSDRSTVFCTHLDQPISGWTFFYTGKVPNAQGVNWLESKGKGKRDNNVYYELICIPLPFSFFPPPSNESTHCLVFFPFYIRSEQQFTVLASFARTVWFSCYAIMALLLTCLLHLQFHSPQKMLGFGWLRYASSCWSCLFMNWERGICNKNFCLVDDKIPKTFYIIFNLPANLLKPCP